MPIRVIELADKFLGYKAALLVKDLQLLTSAYKSRATSLEVILREIEKQSGAIGFAEQLLSGTDGVSIDPDKGVFCYLETKGVPDVAQDS